MPAPESSPVDRLGYEVGDQVQVLANPVKVPVGSLGTIVSFSTGSQHPIVEIAGRGRYLIPAVSLARRHQKDADASPLA